MKLYQKLTSLLVAAVMAAVLMPVCMAAPGDSVETRINNALAQRTGAILQINAVGCKRYLFLSNQQGTQKQKNGHCSIAIYRNCKS